MWGRSRGGHSRLGGLRGTEIRGGLTLPGVGHQGVPMAVVRKHSPEVLVVRGHTAVDWTPRLGGPTQVKTERRGVQRRRRVLGNPRVLSWLKVPPVTQE